MSNGFPEWWKHGRKVRTRKDGILTLNIAPDAEYWLTNDAGKEVYVFSADILGPVKNDADVFRPMSNIDKEWLKQKIADMEATRDDIPFGLGEDGTNTLAALRIALASLEAETVCVIDQSNLDYLNAGYDADVWPPSRTEMGDVLLYRTAPPAPVSVPDEMDLMTCHLDGVTETYADGWNACRDAMLQGAENAESRCTMQPASALDSLPKIAESRCSSPVISDWQTKAEKMAELHGSSFVVFRNGESPQCADPSKVIISFTDEGIGHSEKGHFREISNSSTNNFRENAETSTKCWCHTCRPVTISDMRFVVCPQCGNKRCPHANDHRHACTGSNEPGQEGSAYPAAPQQEA